MNLELKILLIREFGTQTQAALALGIHPSEVTWAIRQYRKPSARFVTAVENHFGKKKVKGVFETNNLMNGS
jgi:DNA-binding transcriptional regulator YdaS (Cro superfamily)